jgi:hypothetical protein
VGSLKKDIYSRAFLRGVEVWHTVTGYDRVPRGCQTPVQMAADAGPSLWKVSLDGGEVVPVCGPTGKDAIMAAALVGIAVGRVIETQHEGKPIQIKVDDDKVACSIKPIHPSAPRRRTSVP